MAPVYFDIVGLIEILALLIAAIVLGGAYAAAKWKGVLAAVVIGGIAMGWFAHKMNLEVEADRSLNDWRRSAWQACEAEFAALPKSIEARSVLDNTAGLVQTELIQLLSERALEFVEVKAASLKGNAILQEDCCNGYSSSLINVGWATKPYIRLTLGKTSAPACRPELTRPSWQAPPFLPDTCLIAEEIDEPSAEVRIEQLEAKQTEPRAWGWRRVVEVKSGKTLAQLTSEEEQGMAGHGAGDRLTRPGDAPRSVDCRKPHSLLADLLRNPRGNPPPSKRQLLSEVTVRASVSLDDLLARAPDLPRVENIRGRIDYLSRLEDTQIFDARGESAWRAHIENAKRSPHGVASHGSKLIDLHAVTLTQLDTGQSSVWKHAAFNGFFVTNERGRAGERMLVRFNRQGKFEWAVSLVVDLGSSISPGANFNFQGIAIERGQFVLYDRGHLVQPKDREQKPAEADAVVTAFRIPLHRLPPMEGLDR